MDLDIWTGNLESENEEEREEYTKGILEIIDFSNCIIEPPGYVRSTKQKGIMIDAAMFPHSKLEAPEKIFKNDDPKEEKYWIFLNDLNSFIFISAKKAELRWKEKKA